MTEPLVQVGWYCWRCHSINEAACRSDNVPIHVPADWADDMREEIAKRAEEEDEPTPVPECLNDACTMGCTTECRAVIQRAWAMLHGAVPDNSRTTPDNPPEDNHVCKPGATTYYCPTVGEVESDCHGGFDQCCDRPDLHQPVVDPMEIPIDAARALHGVLGQLLDGHDGPQRPGDLRTCCGAHIGHYPTCAANQAGAEQGRLRDQYAAATEDAVYQYREMACQWQETDGTTQEIARLTTDAVLAVQDTAMEQLRETNRRLNYRAQQAESELAAYRRAVSQWEVSERGTYIPHASLRTIGLAAGKDILGSGYSPAQMLGADNPAGLREQYAAAIEAVQHGQAAPVEVGDERIVDAVLAVRDTAMEQLRQELATARATIDRARALHVRVVSGRVDVCTRCSDGDYPNYEVVWPCPTIAVLDQPAGEPTP